jgi:hypothetical protein
MGHYCGYARTPLLINTESLRYSGENYINLIEVNGGITYGRDDDGYIGFDCGHSWDVCWDDGEYHDGFALDDENRKDWTAEDVKEEVEYLADQLSTLEQFFEQTNRKLE